MKRNTRRKFLRCNHELSRIFSPHSLNIHTTYSTSSLVQTLKYNRCKFALIIDLCFQQHSYFKFDSLWTDVIKNLWSVWMRQKKPLQKVFTLHYWRFFWFKYLFSLFCITLICLWSCFLGNTMLRRIHRVKAEARAGEGKGLRLSGKQRILAIHTHTCIIYSQLYTVYELACAYSTQVFVF